MQIACERCSTSYVLDDALIPAQGAPVQCTRCGLVFTAKPPAAAAPAEAARRQSSTQMFGAVGTPSVNSTLVFGSRPQPAAQAPAPAAPKRAAGVDPQAVTEIAAAKPAAGAVPTTFPKAGAPAAPAASSTMLFGSGKAPSAEPRPNATMMFGSVPPSERPAPPANSGSSTMMFGALPATAAPSSPAPSAPAKPGSSTMMFGAVPGAVSAPSTSGPSTLTFGAPAAPGSTPAWQAPPPAAGYSPQAHAEPEPVPLTPRLPADAPPALRGMPGELAALTDDASDPLVEELQGRGRRAGLLAVGGLLLAALLGVGYWLSQRPKPLPPELVARTDALFSDIEGDVPAKLEASRKELLALSKQAPAEDLAPAADALVATAMLTADLRDEVASLTGEFERLDKERKKADADHSRADWRSVVAAVVDRMKGVTDQLKPVTERATQLDTEQNALLKQLDAARKQLPEEPAEVERAFGVYFALKGSTENAARFAQLYRAKVPGDGWADFIESAAADHPHTVEAQLRAGLAASQRATKANPRLVRAKRIQVRLLAMLHDLAGARAALAELQLLSPDDARLKRLAAWVEEAAARPLPATP